MVSMAPPEGEEDRSQAYYVIRVSGNQPVKKFPHCPGALQNKLNSSNLSFNIW